MSIFGWFGLTTDDTEEHVARKGSIDAGNRAIDAHIINQKHKSHRQEMAVELVRIAKEQAEVRENSAAADFTREISRHKITSQRLSDVREELGDLKELHEKVVKERDAYKTIATQIAVDRKAILNSIKLLVLKWGLNPDEAISQLEELRSSDGKKLFGDDVYVKHVNERVDYAAQHEVKRKSKINTPLKSK